MINAITWVRCQPHRKEGPESVFLSAASAGTRRAVFLLVAVPGPHTVRARAFEENLRT